jgi:hypothetical protein
MATTNSSTQAARQPWVRRSRLRYLNRWTRRVVYALWCSLWRGIRDGGRLLGRLPGQLWSIGKPVGSSMLRHLFIPALCFACIMVGVLLTLPLPGALWTGLAPNLPASFRGVPPLPLPLPQVFDPTTWPGALPLVVPPALAVFRRHHHEWNITAEPLLTRMLFAAYAGVCWPKVWWPRRRKSSGPN